MRIVVIALPTSIVVPSVMGYAKVKAIAATASASTTTPAAQATLATVRSVTLRPPTFCAKARALAAWGKTRAAESRHHGSSKRHWSWDVTISPPSISPHRTQIVTAAALWPLTPPSRPFENAIAPVERYA